MDSQNKPHTPAIKSIFMAIPLVLVIVACITFAHDTTGGAVGATPLSNGEGQAVVGNPNFFAPLSPDICSTNFPNQSITMNDPLQAGILNQTTPSACQDPARECPGIADTTLR